VDVGWKARLVLTPDGESPSSVDPRGRIARTDRGCASCRVRDRAPGAEIAEELMTHDQTLLAPPIRPRSRAAPRRHRPPDRGR
jgi:hypothetical protein